MSEVQDKKVDVNATREKALDDPSVPKIYANGFTVGLGNADTYVMFQLFGRPVAVVNLSYTLAKTLHQHLGRMISEFEAGVEREMLTTVQVDKMLKEKK